MRLIERRSSSSCCRQKYTDAAETSAQSSVKPVKKNAAELNRALSTCYPTDRRGFRSRSPHRRKTVCAPTILSTAQRDSHLCTRRFAIARSEESSGTVALTE